MSKTPVFTAKPIIVDVDGNDFEFTPSVMDSNNYINEMSLDNKVVPAYNYLTRTVNSDQKDLLKEYLNAVPGLTMELYGMVSSKAKGGITITLKN